MSTIVFSPVSFETPTTKAEFAERQGRELTYDGSSNDISLKEVQEKIEDMKDDEVIQIRMVPNTRLNNARDSKGRPAYYLWLEKPHDPEKLPAL